MAGSVNKVILVGNLGADPEIRHTQDGRAIANLRVATSESWRDKATGERREKTEWHRVVIFNEDLAKIAEQYLKKGSKVYLEGRSRPANGRTSTARSDTRPRWCCRASTASSPCSTGGSAMAAGEGEARGGGDFGRSGPCARQGRRRRRLLRQGARRRDPVLAGQP